MNRNDDSRTSQFPIAIVGTACRLPGAASVAEFWDLLAAGRHAITEPSPDRREAFSGIIPNNGGFLSGIDGFDATFFGYSPYEAVRLDPHHRLMLEVVWEALEDAGLPADRLAGSRTGVYTSSFGGHYWRLLQSAGMTGVHAYLGAHQSSAPAGRITHTLDLRGPSLGIESHCASSLIAVHLACQAIRGGDIDAAIVGGVNLLLSPEDRTGFTEAGIVSPNHRCRFGDEAADGYVPAEGAVGIILKPLDAAIAAGDRVHATVLGSGACSNGKQGGLSASATGTSGQEDLLRTTLRDVGVEPADIDYVEAHGPGTEKGDLVELTALSRVLGDGRDPGQPCLVGSVKSNIGHTEAAAGLAGLLKTVLAMRHRVIPATLHVRRPISVLTAEDAPLELVRTTRTWPDHGRPAVAGVTALGMFGIGAHVVLGEAPPTHEATREGRKDQALLVPLSAKDPAGLPALATAYADTLAAAPEPADVCFSAGAHRTHLPYRLAVAGADRDELVNRLRWIANHDTSPTYVPGRPPRVVFVFSGQGSQWLGMARELLTAEPVFAAALRECAEAIRAEAGWSLVDRLRGPEELADESEIQPALWAIQVSLARVWRHWGVEPDLVVGHSMGEVAAATVTGALTTADGAAVICRRGRLVGTLPAPGAMVAVALGEEEATEAISELAGRVTVAVVNSGQSTVLAGAPDAVAAVVEPLRERGVYCRPVRANYASHSPGVEPLRDTLLAALADVSPRHGEVAMHSTALDRVVSGKELDAAYWMANLRQPVRFAAAVREVLADPTPALFLEISPHPLLVPAIEDEIDTCGADAAAVPSLFRERPEHESLLTALGAVYERGRAPNWTRLYADARRVPLPTYPWQRERFWVPTDPAPTTPTTLTEPAEDAAEAAATETLSLSAEDLAAEDLASVIARTASELLAAPPGSVDPKAPLHVAGMDSVLAGQLRLRLKRDLDLHVPLADLLDDRPLIKVVRELPARSPDLPEPRHSAAFTH